MWSATWASVARMGALPLGLEAEQLAESFGSSPRRAASTLR